VKMPIYFKATIVKPGNQMACNIKIKWWGWAILLWKEMDKCKPTLKLCGVDISFLAKPYLICYFYATRFNKVAGK
jgi:hypothetical protein